MGIDGTLIGATLVAGLLAGTGAVIGAQPEARTSAAAQQRVAERTADRLFARWDAALASGDPATVDALYATDAALLPTLADGLHDTAEERLAYFDGFLAKQPDGEVIEHQVRRLGPDAIVDSGEYEFAFGDGSTAEARFTFVHERVDGTWRIVAHHSSLEPGDHDD